jgi:hypothetical protein
VKQISAIGVLAGAVTDIVLTNLFTVPVGVYAMLTNGILHLPKGQQQAAMIAAIQANAGLYATATIIGCGCSILGGYVAAWIAKKSELLNGGLSAFLCVSFGLYAIGTGKQNEPLWLAILLLPVSPALGAVGGYLRRLGRQRSVSVT